MARRRRRSFSRGSRGGQRGPSRFAQGKRGDRTLEWIHLGAQLMPRRIALLFATGEVVGTQNIAITTMLPQNIASGGEVTLIRIVGFVQVYERIAASAVQNAATPSTQMMGLNIQLTQIIHGAIGTTFLDGEDANDKDSSNFLWRHGYPSAGVTGTVGSFNFLSGSADQPGGTHPRTNIDIRVKRRFDRSAWALVFGMSVLNAEINEWGVSFSFRGLFLTSGGI